MTAANRCMIHATALLVSDAGVLLRGPSGGGKSSLALDLIAFAEQRGVFARLIGDDRLELSNANGRLVARPHRAIEGAIEERGLGIVAAPHEPSGVICCVIDLVEAGSAPRYPVDGALETELCGARLPRLATPASSPGIPRKIFSFLQRLTTI